MQAWAALPASSVERDASLAALPASSVERRFDALHASGLTEPVGREEELELLLRRPGRRHRPARAKWSCFPVNRGSASLD